MSDTNGGARTNFVRVEDLEGLKKSMERFEITVDEHFEEPGYVMLYGTDDHGDWPTTIEDEDGNEIEFSFKDHVMPFIREGEVLVCMSCGFVPGLSYLYGLTKAFIRHGNDVDSIRISMQDIYQRAAEKFHVKEDNIARCSDSDLPEALNRVRHAEARARTPRI